MTERGKYIVLEGGEGCGKTTQAKLLGGYLTERGVTCHVTREPGGVPAAESIRKIVLDPDIKTSEVANFFLFEAGRADFFRGMVLPDLEIGETVVVDRSGYSTLAYQGYGSGIDLDLIKRANELATMGTRPDLLFIIDISAKTGLEKMSLMEFGKKDGIESRGLEYHQRVNQGFLEIARENKDIAVVVPYREGDVDGMQEEMRYHIRERLGL